MDDLLVARANAELATCFEIEIPNGRAITVERRSARKDIGNWAICRGGSCFNKRGEWECEPMPSGRSDAYFRRNRYLTLEEAIGCALVLRAKAMGSEYWKEAELA